MRKVLLIIVIFGLLMSFQNYLQNSHNKTIIKKAPSGKSANLEGYALDWDNEYIYLIDEQETEQNIKINTQTIYLRTYIDEEEKLYGQKRIVLDDFIKEQFVTIDIFRENKESEVVALIVRQIIYVEE